MHVLSRRCSIASLPLKNLLQSCLKYKFESNENMNEVIKKLKKIQFYELSKYEFSKVTRNIKAALILFKSFNNKKLFFIFKKKNFLQFLLSCLASDEFSPYGKNFHSMSETTKENHLFLTL